MGCYVDNLVISKLIKTKTNFKYLIRYLDRAIRPLVLIMCKMRGYVKTLKLKMEIKIQTINWCLSIKMMRSH